ncbi:MAG: ABC transporter permease [Prolixibacteraceae bacterium]|nr:ABC transporter permease [Prolixibacteraceae bacterium]
MIKRFIFSIIRNIRKDVYQSALNIIGLTLGLTAVLYISTYVYNETTFDSFHSKANRIYRIVVDVKMGETGEFLTNSENPMAPAVKNDLPEVEEATRLYFNKNQLIRVSNNKILEERLWYADENIFRVFDFELLEGDKTQALVQPNSIVVTEDFGKKYFGNVSLVGKVINVGNPEVPYTITGILKDIPKNSHFQFKALASYNSLPVFNRIGEFDWGNFRDLYTYVLLKPNTDLKSFEAKFKKLPVKYYGSMMQTNMGISMEQFEAGGNYVKHQLQPLTKIHLDKTFVDDIFVYGNKQMLYILGVIGILILFVACFNFINLTTARASLKAKEIGMKKVLGSSKSIIITQVLSETFVQALLALCASFLVLSLALPLLNSLTGVPFSFVDFIQFPLVFILVSLPFLISVLAGLFPAVIISKYNPVEVIKVKANDAGSRSIVRNGLVALQFVVFIMLIAGTLVIKKQLYHLQNHNPGFSKENVLVIKNSQRIGQSSEVLKNELKKVPEVIDASFTSALPSKFDGSSNPFGKPDDDNRIFLSRLYVDADFLNTLKITLADGRFFSDKINEERNNAVINKKAAELLGWTDSNNKIIFDYNDGGNNYNVIGIVNNFHLGSLKYEQLPVIMRVADQAEYLAIRIRPQSARQVVELAGKEWEELNDKVPFDYFFLDNSFNAQYKTEERLSKLVGLYSAISVIIACFGLLGLVSFASVRRQKEIGIRKVNGAKVSEVLIMLNKDFVKWVVIAFVVATPIAWYAMHKWLENFAYKTALSWWIFAIAGLLALGIALLTVSFQSWKAATKNPVESLRYE